MFKITKSSKRMKIRKVSEWVNEVHQTAIEKGWFEEERQRLELHMLMLTEISEATEEIRNHKPSFYIENGKPEGESIELSDVLLRIFDYAGYKKIDLIHYLKSEADNYKKNYQHVDYIQGATSCPVIRDDKTGDVEGAFRKAIQEAMRKDPDVIMVGEARGEQIAKEAINISQEGHLVSTTDIPASAFKSMCNSSALSILEGIVANKRAIAEKENIDFESISELTEFFSVVSQKEKWFKSYENFVSPLEKHMLFSMTIAEASQAVLVEDFEEEARFMARTLIQIFVYFYHNGWDANEILDAKHSFNMARSYKHGGKKC